MARRTYALRACDYCDVELPGNELVAVTDRVVSGTRRGSRSYVSTRGTVGSGSSSSTYYKVLQRKICGECYDRRAAAIRRERFLKFVGTCVFIAIVVGVIAAFIAYHPTRSSPINSAEDAPANAAIGDTNAPVAEDDAAAVLPVATPDAGASDNSTASADTVPSAQADDQRPQDDQRSARPMPPRDFTNDYARAINSVTPTALESGQPERWEAAGGKGYVVPSSPQSYGTQTCRNVYSTIFYGERQSQSAPVRWCRDGDGGDWHLAN